MAKCPCFQRSPSAPERVVFYCDIGTDVMAHGLCVSWAVNCRCGCCLCRVLPTIGLDRRARRRCSRGAGSWRCAADSSGCHPGPPADLRRGIVCRRSAPIRPRAIVTTPTMTPEDPHQASCRFQPAGAPLRISVADAGWPFAEMGLTKECRHAWASARNKYQISPDWSISPLDQQGRTFLSYPTRKSSFHRSSGIGFSRIKFWRLRITRPVLRD